MLPAEAEGNPHWPFHFLLLPATIAPTGDAHMDNIQGAVGNPKFTKISDFAADRLTGFIRWQFFQVEKIQNFALKLN